VKGSVTYKDRTRSNGELLGQVAGHSSLGMCDRDQLTTRAMLPWAGNKKAQSASHSAHGFRLCGGGISASSALLPCVEALLHRNGEVRGCGAKIPQHEFTPITLPAFASRLAELKQTRKQHIAAHPQTPKESTSNPETHPRGCCLFRWTLAVVERTLGEAPNRIEIGRLSG
jgi:hypothetical protein